MIEVFKTNVTEHDQASMLLSQIHKIFIELKASFDLEDCDKILRVQSSTGAIQTSSLVKILQDFGFHAEVLPDSVPAAGNYLLQHIKVTQ